MQKLHILIRNWHLPKRIKLALFRFSKTEWKIFLILCLVSFVSAVGILQNINKSLTVQVPMRGGVLTEGILGTPRFVNPLLASSDADRDLVSLVYGGLMRKDTDGNLIPDLAESYQTSSDGLSYTFKIKDNAVFHDGKAVTADDVLFTITSAKDPILKSPRRAAWDGVNVEKVDAKTVKFTLRQPYSSFLENTTMGIMPAHIWQDSPIELNEANMQPVGTGPFMVESINKQSSGIIDEFDLKSFRKFTLGRPYLNDLRLKFYQREEDLVTAIENKEVDQASSISPEEAEKLKALGFHIESLLLPRVFGLFFNQNQNLIFTDKSVVQAINTAIDKDKIVNEVLSGYGTSIDGPLPPSTPEYYKIENTNKKSREDRLNTATLILNKAGWTKNADGILTKTSIDKNKKKKTDTLSFSISTGNAPELARAVEIMATDLRALGMLVEVKTFEIGNLNQIVIRPRKYDALFFGEIINHESDLFAFWHSSQRKDPGLNVAMYANPKVDKILEDAFVAVKPEDRVKKYAQFEEEIKKDVPAVFVYSPSFIYVVSPNLGGFAMHNITFPGDRFLNAYLWYTKVDDVWKFFVPKDSTNK